MLETSISLFPERRSAAPGMLVPHGPRVNDRFEENSEVELSVQRGRLVVRCIRRFRYDLATLLAKVTPQNQHPEMDWGSPVGKETW